MTGSSPAARFGMAIHLLAMPTGSEDEREVLEVALLVAADDAFDFIEVGPLQDQALRRTLAGWFEAAGVGVIFNSGPAVWGEALDPGSADAGARAHARSRLLELVREARGYGATVFQVSPGPDPGPAHRRDALQWTAECMHALAEAAGPMAVALEPYDRERYARRLIGPVGEAVEVARQVGTGGFGLLLDTSHLRLAGEDLPAAVRAAAPWLRHVHLANCVVDDAGNPRYGDQHPHFGVKDGAFDASALAPFLGALHDVGYLAPPSPATIGVEIKRAGEERPELLLANAARTFRQAWAIAFGGR